MSRASKIKRLSAGYRPRTLDLFSGCGGFSLGFLSAGFEVIGAVEKDSAAARTHAFNFFSNSNDDERHAQARDITTVHAEELLDEIRQYRPDAQVDVITGGPPCQVYTRVGRAKLREIADHPEAHLRDSRGALYHHLLDYVRVLDPLAVVIENVPDMLTYGRVNVAEEICATLEDLGYRCTYSLLLAAHYGVPQLRQRVFIIAVAEELAVPLKFPPPTHQYEIPSGYFNPEKLGRKIATSPSMFDKGGSHYCEPPAPSSELPSAVTARQALRDLPACRHHLQGDISSARQRLGQPVDYRSLHRVSSYARSMRDWPGFDSNGTVTDHVIRHTPRDFPIFRRMRPGEEYPVAVQRAETLLQERVEANLDEGVVMYESSPVYARLRREIVPPYDPSKFTSKWCKIRPNQPCRTLTAHLGKDTYSHIHYDKHQARAISIREAARLQSFPDGFRFAGNMGDAFRMIGNSVPPLLARAVALQLHQALVQGVASDVARGERTTAATGGDGAIMPLPVAAPGCP